MMLTNLHDAFRGQSRSSNIVQTSNSGFTDVVADCEVQGSGLGSAEVGGTAKDAADDGRG